MHLASSESQADGRAIISSFLDKMEGMAAGVRQSHGAVGNSTLLPYLRTQLSQLRAQIDRLEGLRNGRDSP
jgi:hypothetical protein